jgi:hypothetical protein
LAAGLVELRGLTMDAATGVRVTALWLRLGSWCEAESMVSLAEAVDAAQLIAGAETIGAMKLVGEELAAMTHLSFSTDGPGRSGRSDRAGAAAGMGGPGPR